MLSIRSRPALALCGLLLMSCAPFRGPVNSSTDVEETGNAVGEAPPAWTVDTPYEWNAWSADTEHLNFSGGRATPTRSTARFQSVLKQYGRKRKAKRITVEQVPLWNNWTAVSGVEPAGGGDAPIFIPVGENNYWYLNAESSGGVYGAWNSTDMKSWTHYPKVIGKDWVTTAEYADGTFYLYYDEPNDQDPHLVIDDDLTDPEHREAEEVFADPSHGSDAGVLRTEDGSFHLIYEDWSPLHAPRHEWDSPLAGHTSSPDGVSDFGPHEHPAPIDERTVPLPEHGTYDHASGDSLLYHKHAGPQNAYGDYTLIQVGDQYYIFCDYNPQDGPMRVGYWTSDSLTTEFQWGGEIGKGFHPDPTIGFAEGKFYLIVQRTEQDYVSSGPWTGRVEARVGVDEEGDGTVDQWTSWRAVEETYSRKPGFARIVKRTPAALDLFSLPPGHGFRFEFRTETPEDSEANSKPKPILDRVRLSFE